MPCSVNNIMRSCVIYKGFIPNGTKVDASVHRCCHVRRVFLPSFLLSLLQSFFPIHFPSFFLSLPHLQQLHQHRKPAIVNEGILSAWLIPYRVVDAFQRHKTDTVSPLSVAITILERRLDVDFQGLRKAVVEAAVEVAVEGGRELL